MTEDPPFEVGDLVRLRRGKSPMRVMEVKYGTYRKSFGLPSQTGWRLRTLYVSAENYQRSQGYGDSELHWEKLRSAEDFVLLQTETEMEESEEIKSGTLFQIHTETEKELYGTYLTTNSVGHYVLEMKGGSGEVKAFPPSALEEVVPFTVRVRRVTAQSEREVHWQIKPESLTKGDFLVDQRGTRYVVTATDTRSRSTQKVPEGLRRIVTEPVHV